MKSIDGGAKAGCDFNGVDELISFNVGDYMWCFTVELIDDDNWEEDEDFFIQLYDSTNEEIGTCAVRESSLAFS